MVLDDLISAGYVGLVEAAASYDAARGKSFASFAEYRIRGAMLDDIRALDPLSRDMRNRSNKVLATTAGLELQLGRAPDVQEIATRMGIGVAELHRHRQTVLASLVLFHDDAGGDLLDVIGDARAADPLEATIRREVLARLRAALEALPARMQQVLALYYIEDLNLRQVGVVLGVTESRICQIHREAIALLRGAGKGERLI